MKEIFVIGDRDPSMITHRELDAVLSRLPAGVRARWVGTDTPLVARSADAAGIWVAPGSPYRDDAAVYAVIASARTSGQPFLGTCGGFQYAVLEFARSVAGIQDASHAEVSPTSDVRVVDRLACSLVGVERVVTAVPGTRMHALCGGESFVGFHWCNYGLVGSYVDRLVEHGLVIGATADDAGVEAIELANHPFFLATLFQPQVGASSGDALHPVVEGFLAAV
jgi:CTP synthase (UTP-ammonia lyase)